MHRYDANARLCVLKGALLCVHANSAQYRLTTVMFALQSACLKPATNVHSCIWLDWSPDWKHPSYLYTADMLHASLWCIVSLSTPADSIQPHTDAIQSPLLFSFCRCVGGLYLSIGIETNKLHASYWCIVVLYLLSSGAHALLLPLRGGRLSGGDFIVTDSLQSLT